MSSEWDKLEETRDVMESAIAQSMVIYGVTPSVGRIYGVLYFAGEPLSIDEIKVQVAMSKASVSNGLRELQETEMVTKVWKKGERKDHFIAEKDFMRNFIYYFVKKIRQERNLLMKAAEQTKPALQEMTESTDDEVRETARRDLELIQEAQDYLDWTTRFANTLESREMLEYIPPAKRNKGAQQ